MKRLLPRLGAKICAVFLFFIMASVCLLSSAGIYFLATTNAYLDGGAGLRDQVMSRLTNTQLDKASEYCKAVAQDLSSAQNYASAFSEKNSNFSFTAVKDDGSVFLSNYTTDEYQYSLSRRFSVLMNSHLVQETQTFASQLARDEYVTTLHSNYEVLNTEYLNTSGEGYSVYVRYIRGDAENVEITGYVRSQLTDADAYYHTMQWVDKLIAWRNALIAISVVTLLGVMACFGFLLCAAGHKEGAEGIHSNWVDVIPFDLYLVIITGLGALCVLPVTETSGTQETVVFGGLAAGSLLCLFLSLCLTFATRCKAGTLWKNTVIYSVLRFLLRLCRRLVRIIGRFFTHMPLYWKTALVFMGLSLLELIAIDSSSGGWWVCLKLLVLGALCFIVYQMRLLQTAGKELAEGNMDCTVDTRYMYGELKAHGKNLNSITDGMQRAIQEKMKSEHLKTELITNVSHDIKTPLTSIINYVDLLKKEPIASDSAREYLDVLDRQSARLKKLIEDLIEASKASTGNLPVSLEDTDLNVLLTQAAGEYESRLAQSRLEMVWELSEQSPHISADGKLLWRVFDNLFNNICKYALEGTRVYLSTMVKDGRAVVAMKNISRCALNISSDELMERFVRGDSSRNTEGSGLGLSIAKSLTELQKGSFSIDIDGDLFKVSVSFPKAT
ncbi:MAG: HAMP domain-containing sensor histidine kinase [Oscillibacter sp.]|nr:HAMP domain-containing sensor histidine kinase [Oscillibacter sp.]